MQIHPRWVKAARGSCVTPLPAAPVKSIPTVACFPRVIPRINTDSSLAVVDKELFTSVSQTIWQETGPRQNQNEASDCLSCDHGEDQACRILRFSDVLCFGFILDRNITAY